MLDSLIGPLQQDLRQALGSDLVALYLTGSAAGGDFDENVSDIDLVAVTAVPAEDLPTAALHLVHSRFVERNSAWRDRLEIVYVDEATLADLTRGGDNLAVISPGEAFHVTGPASDWLVNWHQLRTSGVALVGPPPSELVAPIATPALIAAIRNYLDYLASQPLERHHPGGLAYAVLSVCRARHSLETGSFASKLAAAAWMKTESPDHADVLDAAVAVRKAGGHRTEFDERTRERAIEFVRRSAAEFGAAAQKERDPGPDEAMGTQRNR